MRIEAANNPTGIGSANCRPASLFDRSGMAAMVAWLCTVLGFLKCSRGAISPLTALMLIPMSGAIAYSVELGSWYYVQRSMQNAADSAAIAAATNNTTAANVLLEARAAAKKFGYTDGVNNTTVNAVSATCPTGTTAGATCYSATVSTIFPVIFSRVIGFNGDTTYGLGRGQTIQALAIATTAGGGGSSTTTACYWALSNDPAALVGHGIPFANLTGCSVLSNGGIDCTGHDMGADYAISASSTARPNCAATTAGDKFGATLPPDPYGGSPYAALASSAASAPCGSNPTKGSLSGTLLVYCGNTSLSGDLTLTSKNTVVVIKNGGLDLNNKTLSTAAGASATIVFTGTAAPFGDKNMKGTIDIQAPSGSTDPWKGVAIYRPSTGPDVDSTLAGSQATWNISGLVYFPHVNVTVDGVVNKSANGATCFVLVANIITINGNGTILNSTTGCNSAGLTPPSVVVGGGTTTREKLVQ